MHLSYLEIFCLFLFLSTSNTPTTPECFTLPFLENDNDDYRNDNDNYDSDVIGHDDGVHDYDVSASSRNAFHPFSNFPSSSIFFTQFPGSFDEMFGKSPHRSQIFEEFNNYWRHFNNTGNNF